MEVRNNEIVSEWVRNWEINEKWTDGWDSIGENFLLKEIIFSSFFSDSNISDWNEMKIKVEEKWKKKWENKMKWTEWNNGWKMKEFQWKNWIWKFELKEKILRIRYYSR